MTNRQSQRIPNEGPGDRPDEPAPAAGLTPLGVGLILGVVALIVFCCLGWAVLAAFMPPPTH